MKATQTTVKKPTEFYIQMDDIAAELAHYKTRLYHKVIYCPGENPFTSKIFEFLVTHFREYKLKAVVTSCGKSEASFGNTLDFLNQPMSACVTNTANITNCTSLQLADLLVLFGQKENSLKKIAGNGEIQSADCRAFLHHADVVIGTPTPADFGEVLDTVITHGKSFILLGPKLITVSKTMAQYFTEGKVNLGVSHPERFVIPVGANGFTCVETGDDGVVTGKLKNMRWYSSFNTAKDKDKLQLTAKYVPESYPRYVNYDAIDVCNLEEVPKDYKEPMGVPIGYLEFHDPKKFEIVGFSSVLAAPMYTIASRSEFSTGGNRFYTTRLTDSDRARGYIYHREFDRVVIKKIVRERRKTPAAK